MDLCALFVLLTVALLFRGCDETPALKGALPFTCNKKSTLIHQCQEEHFDSLVPTVVLCSGRLHFSELVSSNKTLSYDLDSDNIIVQYEGYLESRLRFHQ